MVVGYSTKFLILENIYMLRMKLVFLAVLFTSACAHGKARKIDDFHWEGVERVVGISDLHADYGQYIKVMQSAGLINSRGKWSGGKTHLVQTGDIPDRGSDTRKIIDHLAGLKKQAERKGGKIHTLIGNHEAMNVYGDLRYTYPGEFEEFVSKNSAAYREKQWEFQLQQIKQVKPEAILELDLDKYRIDFEKQVPLGWVEHRMAWQPKGEYGQWVMNNQVAVMVNKTIFLHGGLSPDYCKYSLAEITDMAHEQMQNYDREVKGVINASTGPLWDRALAREDEDYYRPAVDQILDRYGAERIVVGHSPTGGVVWPRFEGRIVVNDTGIANHYGANIGWFEHEGGKVYAGYEGQRLELPTSVDDRVAYLEQVISFQPDNQSHKQRLAELTAPPAITEADNSNANAEGGSSVAEDQPPEKEPISHGICLPAY
jgi:hypothetical protein